MGYRTGINAQSEDKYAFTLFNSVFGSGVNSKLFKVVREQMHLCYYASCVPELTKGVAFISSGIDAKNEQIATDVIKKQLDAVRQGDFTDEDILDCKKALRNAYNELYDSPDGLCGWYLGRVMFGDTECIESVSEKIMAVTREQIISAASKMQLDTVFMLKGVSKTSECGGADDEQ
jgi:predicted Zn-dependent peptidase